MLLRSTLMGVSLPSFSPPTSISYLTGSVYMTSRSKESFSNLQAAPALEKTCKGDEGMYYLEKSEECEREESMGVELKPSLDE